MRRLATGLFLPIAVVLLASCGTASTQVAPSTPHANAGAGGGAGSWPTYHRTNSRVGTATHAVSGPLSHAWTRQLDGAVYGEALYVHGKIFAATERNSVYQIDPGNGTIQWRHHLARPASQNAIQADQPNCGDIFPLGITGTPAYDASTNSIFVVTETHRGAHKLWALNANSGAVRWHVGTDKVPERDRFAEQQRSALLVSGGRVFTTYGGLSGDCGNYVGYVTSTSVTGKGKTTHYAVPTKREAGMWSPAGPVVGQNGNIYVASGNGAEFNGRWDKSDSVTELSPKSLHGLGVFAPAKWKIDNQQDLDLGSSSPIPVAGRILIAGKRGTLYLLKQRLGGIGSQVTSLGGCTDGAFGGAARSGHIVVMPCRGGIRALKVTKHSMHWLWTASSMYGSPVIAGNNVILAHGPEGGLPGTLSVLSLATGKSTASTLTGALTHFPSVTVVGNLIVVPTLSGLTAIRGH